MDGYDIEGNELINVMRGINLHEATSYDNVRIFRNKIRFISGIATTGGIMLSANQLGSCLIADNDVGQQDPYSATGSYAIAIGRAEQVTLRHNTLRMKSRSSEIYLARDVKVAGAENRRADGSVIQVSSGFK